MLTKLETAFARDSVLPATLVEHRMGGLGAQSIRRDAIRVITNSGKGAARPKDLIGQFFSVAVPDRLLVADFIPIAAWLGFAYAAFIISTFIRRIAEWNVPRNTSISLAFGALEIASRYRSTGGDLMYHNDVGVQVPIYRLQRMG